MNVIKHTRNIHELEMHDMKFELAVLSDIHWDNPKCDREKLKKDLDYCVKHEIPITAVEWWKPYAHLLTVIGYGNHETGIIKHQETDILARFVDLLNYQCKTNIQTGGYGGWLILTKEHGTRKLRVRAKYYHGGGGGGIVTRGAINLTRALEMYEDMDVFTMGHIHENWARNDMRETLLHSQSVGFVTNQKHIHSMITGTYKDEYQDGYGGWHIERGAPVKILGGRILKVNFKIINANYRADIDSVTFPR